ncbi:MAG: hypothetical protein LBG17_01935 [Bacteroidales bacterium]|jgi:membrane-associated phospholipid phosphatase|nr:hypothetical protein [Bacteroidales bacterium]
MFLVEQAVAAENFFGDVVCGALLGIAIGTAMFYLCRFITQKCSMNVSR